MEAKPAKTSLQTAFPYRFVDETKYFIRKGIQKPQHLKLKKSKLLEVFNDDMSEKIKNLIKKNKIDLNEETELLQLIVYANSIASN